MNVKPIIKQGWLKVKTASHSKWHRRYCTAQLGIIFLSSKPNSRYQDWIQLRYDSIVNDYEQSQTASSEYSHLPFVIEIRTKLDSTRDLLHAETKQEFDSWLIATKRAAFSQNGGGIFGQSLQETYDYAKDKTSFVPLIVQHCCEHLLKYGSNYVGLFRIPGKQTVIKELRDMYDRGIVVKLDKTYAPATVSSLLKIYLQSLPEPIIPDLDFDSFLEIGCSFKYQNENERDEKISRLKQTILNLPDINYHVLKYLCLFMKKISDQSSVNKMDSENLSVVFGSNIIRPPEKLDMNMIKGHNFNLLPLMKVLIDESEELFNCSSFIAGDVVNDEQRSVMTDTLTTVTNSIDLPSKSSSLTANDQLLSMQRSKSLQFVRTSTISSTDSGTLSNNSSDFDSKKNNTVKCRATVLSRSDDLSPRHLSFSTCKEPSLQSTRGENSSDDIEIHSVIEMQTENETLLTQKSQTKLSASCDAILTKIEHETTEIVEPIKQRYPAMNGNHIQNGTEQGENLNRSLSLTPAVTRKMTKIPAKKGLVSKVGKSFSTLKSNVVKALHPQQQQQQSLSNKQPISTDNSHQNGVNHQEESELKSNSTSFPQETISKRRREDEINLHHSPFNEFLPMNNNTTDSINIPETSSPIDPTDTIAKLKHEIDTLNNRLIKNELLIEHLTTASQNERLTFTHERLQLTKTIEDLTADNKRLRQQIKEGDQYISDKYSRRRSLKYSQNACLNDISRSLSKIDKRISNVNEQQQSLISTSLTTVITTTESNC